jgi:hypothetical protein
MRMTQQEQVFLEDLHGMRFRHTDVGASWASSIQKLVMGFLLVPGPRPADV